MKFTPLGDRILVRQDSADEKTAGGIYLAPNAQEKPYTGVVLAIGNGRQTDSGFIPVTLRVGDLIYFSRFGGVKVSLADYTADGKKEDLYVLRESEVLLVMRAQ